METPYIARATLRRVRAGAPQVEVLCAPERPGHWTSLFKILHELNYRMVSPSQAEADLVIFWQDTTFPAEIPLPASRWGIPPINYRCRDISKERVDRAMDAVFGYSLNVEPTSFRGQCVEKSNMNARHDGSLRNCPISEAQPGKVYQRYVNTMIAPGSIEEIRVVVIGKEIPLCHRRLKADTALQDRFGQKWDSSPPVATSEVLTQHEVDMILTLSADLGLDFCEMDAGRDREDGRLYIYDVNATPLSPPNSCTPEERAKSVHLLAESFARQFSPMRAS